MTGETVFLAVDKCAELPDIQRQTMEIVDGVVSELPGQKQTCQQVHSELDYTVQTEVYNRMYQR